MFHVFNNGPRDNLQTETFNLKIQGKHHKNIVPNDVK